MPQRLSIGDLGKATGTKVATIRYYERIGLLPSPARTAGNYRSYDARQLGRLSFIRRARDLGFSLDQLRALLDLSDQKERTCDAVDSIARQPLAEVDRRIADLTALHRELDALIGQCRRGTIAECRIIKALAPASWAAPARRRRMPLHGTPTRRRRAIERLVVSSTAHWESTRSDHLACPKHDSGDGTGLSILSPGDGKALAQPAAQVRRSAEACGRRPAFGPLKKCGQILLGTP